MSLIERGRSEVTVSVIIPTVGRPELARAVRSVRAQTTLAQVQVVVVFDAPLGAELVDGVDNAADVVIWTGGRRGGSAARNLGVEGATGDFVAFLDDDDEWLPEKLERQLDLVLATENPETVIVSGRHVHVGVDSGKVSRAGPTRLIESGQTIESYLFVRRSPNGGRASLYTSTLLCARPLALSQPWDTTLKRHQDWDWTIRLGRRTDVTLLQVATPIVRIQTGTANSISASSSWLPSLEWASATLRDEPRVFSDFLMGQTFRYALQARDWKGAWKVLREIVASRRVPSAGPIVIGMAGLMPRRSIERVMSATTGLRVSKV